MDYCDKQRTKRIFTIILIIICLALIIYFVTKSTYKKEQNMPDGCKNFYEHCICIGILTGESIKISFKPNEENLSYYCQGLEYCWDINETLCS